MGTNLPRRHRTRADHPIAPRSGFAEALLDRLLAELGNAGTAPAIGAASAPPPDGQESPLAATATFGAHRGVRPRPWANLATAALLVLTLAAGYAAARVRPDDPTVHPAAAGWSTTLVLRATLDGLPAGPVDARLERWAFPPAAGERRGVAPSLPALFFVEAGRLTATVDAGATVGRTGAAKRSGAPVPPGYPAPLRDGDLLLVPPGSRFSLRHDDGDPATLLVVVLTAGAAAAEERPVEVASPPVSVQTLGAGTLAGVGGGAGTVAVRRLALPSVGAIPGETTAGPELLVVETGTIALRPGAGARETTHSAGDAASAVVPAGTSLALRNADDAPLGVLRLTIAAPAANPGTAIP